ncbi:MAG: leucyl aminopeptidase family protein [Syntrophothermus sp.]
MNPAINKADELRRGQNLIILTGPDVAVPDGILSRSEVDYILAQSEGNKKENFSFDRLGHWIMVMIIKGGKESYKLMESCRKAGDSAINFLNDQKAETVMIHSDDVYREEILAFAEGVLLGSYRFSKYKTSEERLFYINEVSVHCDAVSKSDLEELRVLSASVFRCRDLINEPNSYLTASVFAGEVEKMAREAGVKVESLNKQKIESLKMGGLLGTNKGSFEPPVFMILEWKPENAVNQRPYVLVGKGVMYDTGGMNLKPGDSMVNMKDDMSGAAAVAMALIAVARAKLPVHVISLIPATDNRPGPEAIVSGDILMMHNRMTVEVVNTDAEGRLILADALSYAKKFDPMLVIDLATLTGSAFRAVGKYGIVSVQQDADEELRDLQVSGWRTYERIVDFPNWEEYGELIKSDVADLKNIGPAEGGAITAGKFLQNFISFPHIHLDIAGPAFLTKKDSYRGNGGTGVGVRLLFDFLKRRAV